MESTSKHSGWITFSVIVSAIALLCDIIWLVAMMLGESAKFVVFMISAISVFIILPVFILDVAGFISSFFTKDSRKNLLMGLSGAGIGLLILVSILLFNGGVDAKKIGTLEPSKNIVDSLAAEIGLSREILNEVRDRLYKAKCHSIRIIKQDGTYDVATLMFRRDMASAYYYEIHNIAMTETEMEAVDADDCERIVFNPHVCFVYGSPAFGDMAFPGKQEYLEGRRSNATF